MLQFEHPASPAVGTVLLSIATNSVSPSNNFLVTVASVTPNRADGEISAVPYLSIAECYPPTPLA